MEHDDGLEAVASAIYKYIKEGRVEKLNEKMQQGFPPERAITDQGLSPLGYACSFIPKDEEELRKNQQILHTLLQYHPELVVNKKIILVELHFTWLVWHPIGLLFRY